MSKKRTPPRVEIKGYEVKLSFEDLAGGAHFMGEIEIKFFKKGPPSKRITLSADGLKIDEVQLLKIDRKTGLEEVPVERVVSLRKVKELRIHSKEILYGGLYVLKLKYSSHISEDGLVGIYASQVAAGDSSEEIIVTQFEPDYASRLIPCFDDPAAKAIFNLKLSVPTRFLSSGGSMLFNTKEELREECGDYTEITFSPTPKMSTYLLALIAGRLRKESALTKSGVEINLWCAESRTDSLGFAVDVAKRGMELLEDFFGAEFLMSKCDFVAVPDFEVGGMENWGLIALREDLVFCHNDSSLFDKFAVAQTIVHEIAHQWFGNLVTMEWWDELWLNEGFAEFMSYLILDKMFPEWKVWEIYYVIDRDEVMRIDSIMNSRPIVPDSVSFVGNIEDNFDEVAYPKSCGLVLMIYDFIGERAFREGLQDYFSKFNFSNTRSEDLIDCWSKSCGFNLAGFLKSWTSQAGVPKLKVSYEGPKGGESSGGLLSLEQSRFLVGTDSKDDTLGAHPKDIPARAGKQQRTFYENYASRLKKESERAGRQGPVWHIPVSIVGQDGRVQRFVMKKGKMTMQLAEGFVPLKLNAEGKGLYVTEYDQSMLQLISAGMGPVKPKAMDVLNWLSDLINLNKAGKDSLGVDVVLATIYEFRDQLNPRLWGLIGSYLNFVNKFLEAELGEGFLLEYCRGLCENVATKLKTHSYFDESKSLVQAEVMAILVMAGDKDSTELAASLLGGGLDSESFYKVNQELRGLALVSLAKLGGSDIFEAMLKGYEESLEDLELRESLSLALSFFSGLRYSGRLIEIMKDDDLVRVQDVVDWFAGLVNNPKNREAVYEWLGDGGLDWLSGKLGAQSVPALMAALFASVLTKGDLEVVSDILGGFKDREEFMKSYKENLELAKSRFIWVDGNRERVRDFLAGFAGGLSGNRLP